MHSGTIIKDMNIEKIKRGVQRFAKYRLRKIHLDWLISILSIPVLFTAIVINWGNLTHKAPAPTVASPSPQVIVVPQTNTNNNQETSPSSCTKNVGPITISSPTEGQAVNDNPVCITIDYTNSSYCSVVWSYRINGGSWSDFSNNTPCLYNLPNGNVTFDLRVNSTVSSDNLTLSRHFIYTGSTTVATPTISPTQSPTPTTVASGSAH